MGDGGQFGDFLCKGDGNCSYCWDDKVERTVSSPRPVDRPAPGWVKWEGANRVHWTNDAKTTICGYEIGGRDNARPFQYVEAPQWVKNYWGWNARDVYRKRRYCGDCTRIWAVLNKDTLPPVTPDERIRLEKELNERT